MSLRAVHTAGHDTDIRLHVNIYVTHYLIVDIAAEALLTEMRAH